MGTNFCVGLFPLLMIDNMCPYFDTVSDASCCIVYMGLLAQPLRLLNLEKILGQAQTCVRELLSAGVSQHLDSLGPLGMSVSNNL